jgi:predicted PhzF superfamily epimerase YddE/YHI9
MAIASPQDPSALTADFAALYRSHSSISGVLVAAAASDGDGYDFHSRYLGPWSGTNEDPVTGGTHTFLRKYWSQRLGKTKMRSLQSSQRSGFMDVELVDGHVLISSHAIIVLEGQITVRAN